ncbi:MAG TPA: phytanoyl-CoA dioxygenase family protein, partial [Sphingomicrobium sp.]
MTISKMTSAAGFWTRRLLSEGYCVIPDVLDPAILRKLDGDLAGNFRDTPFCRGGFYGERTKRFGRLLIRTDLARLLVQHPLILAITDNVLGPWCDRIQLNLTQAVAVHPGALAQFPHRDQDMWRGEIGKVEYLVNVMWPFTDYRRENGATLIWPRSHGRKALSPEPDSEPVAIEASPGSAI